MIKLFNWITKRIFSDENVGYLMQKAQPYMKEVIKDSIYDVLEDEELAADLNKYANALVGGVYDTYSKKFFGTIGGIQKGINNTPAGFAGFNLSDLIKNGIAQFLLGRFGVGTAQNPTPQPPPANEAQNRPRLHPMGP